jgi:peptidoglycan/LPS O-acetylase OafA/YrhL
MKVIGFFAAFLAVILAFLEIYARAVEVFPEFGSSTVAAQTPWPHLALWSYFTFLMALGAILVSVRFNRYFPANAGLRRTVRLLGLTTYPMYLLHERAGEYVISQMRHIGVSALPSAMIALVGTGIVSLAIAWFFEPALRNLLKSMGRSMHRDTKKPALQST